MVYKGLLGIVMPARPYLMQIPKKTSKGLRKKLAEKAKKSKCPVVKKTINKTTGKVVVNLGSIQLSLFMAGYTLAQCLRVEM